MIDDEYGVFVSPNGSDGADGSKATPFATIGKGLTSAKSSGKRLYVCADDGAFDETVALTSTNAGVKAWGSFKCSDWAFDDSIKAKVAPSAEGYALTADSVNTATTLDGFEFEALSATAAGGSSIAAFVKTSNALTLSNVRLVAGDGMKGADGAPSNYSQPAGGLIDGKNATGLLPGASQPFNACPGGGATAGATGGLGDLTMPGSGGDGTPTSTSPNPNGGKGGLGGLPLKDCNSEGGSGRTGNPGLAGSSGIPSSALGALDGTGWVPATSVDGTPGTVGQGGGGGRGGTTGGGGGGGAGGCGGAPGGSGKGGGASIALLLLTSPITLVNADLVAADAGAGGRGANGQDGLFGGGSGARAGSGSQLTFGCNGGVGGDGGPGGGGAGGAGGVSVGILHLGMAASVTGGAITIGNAGAAGVGGTTGTAGAKAPDGLAGVAAQVREHTN